MKSFNQIVREVNEAGYLINGLSQFEDGSWWVQLRKSKEMPTISGQGYTAGEAVLKAFAKRAKGVKRVRAKGYP